jgi:hypothetical protein
VAAPGASAAGRQDVHNRGVSRIKTGATLRSDVAITYIDGEGKSGQFYASRFAEENQITVRAIISPARFSPLIRSYYARNPKLAAIVIFDDIVASGETFEIKLTSFVRENEVVLREVGKPIVAIALAGTESGGDRVRGAMAEFSWLDFQLRLCEPLLPNSFAFDPANDIWKTDDEFQRAKALCRDLGVNIYPDAPLGFEGQGLLIAFSNTCPDNTLPIIHSESIPGAARKWVPLFPRKKN